MKPTADLEGIELCITVDDLPIHGLAHPTLSRREVARLFLDVFKKHNLTGVCGFVNGAQTEPEFCGNILKLLGRKRPSYWIATYLRNNGIYDLFPYLNGQFPQTSESYLEILKDWVNAGHVLGNHNYWHSDANLAPPSLFIKGVERCEKLIEEVSGTRTSWFRYPYLKEGGTRETRNTLRQYLSNHGYRTVPATVFCADYAWNKTYLKWLSKRSQSESKRLEQRYQEVATLTFETAVRAARKLFGRDIKHVLVLHLSAFTALSLDKFLSDYTQRGVRFIGVEEAMTDEVYSHSPDVVLTGKGKNFLEQTLIERGESHCIFRYTGH